MPHFVISPHSIDPAYQAALLKNPGAGAFASFEGWIRNHNDGRDVAALEYEVFPELAISEGQLILAEAIQKFQLKDAACIHREGSLVIGDLAVWVGAVSAHRDEAFRACRYIIDEIKSRLPIWKHETYRDGKSEWVNCQHASGKAHGHDQGGAAYYDRQHRLSEVGESGQAKLKKARVLVVGAGGLGSAAIQSLAGAGIGQIGICDFDRLEVSNLNRQFLYAYKDAGRPKAQLAALRIDEANPFIKIVTHEEKLTTENAKHLISSYDLVLDCTDNFTASFVLNDACLKLGRDLIIASVHRFEGQLLIVRPGTDSGCLRCLWSEADRLMRLNSSCEDAGIIGAIPALMGSMQALEGIKLILGLQTDMISALLLWDGLTHQTTHLKRQRNPVCAVCGNTERSSVTPELVAS